MRVLCRPVVGRYLTRISVSDTVTCGPGCKLNADLSQFITKSRTPPSGFHRKGNTLMLGLESGRTRLRSPRRLATGRLIPSPHGSLPSQTLSPTGPYSSIPSKKTREPTIRLEAFTQLARL